MPDYATALYMPYDSHHLWKNKYMEIKLVILSSKISNKATYAIIY